ncbi:hypothetical protein PJF56_02295 [Roseofilum sp. BLCC_M91]|uniref:Uncharacterized protein n=1 Tax=Roseofilum halophilum BLCC-M91 TaxID=3022259 RepID=A0ABT7BET5_9CYAN|nr:hypothetical protein [Roseofilum halophilum]MDJ1177686.1 hypothetical protein [Roseofilum halophilum BLCC-M91]
MTKGEDLRGGRSPKTGESWIGKVANPILAKTSSQKESKEIGNISPSLC